MQFFINLYVKQKGNVSEGFWADLKDSGFYEEFYSFVFGG